MIGVVACVIAFALSATAVSAQPAGDPRGVLEVEGATYAELDEGTGLLTLRGHPVAVRRGAIRLRAPAIVYDTKQRILRASGGVVYADPALTMEAPEATVWIDAEHLLAVGGVTAVQGQGADAIRLRAARLEVTGRDRRAVAAGAVEVVSAEGRMTGDRVEVAVAQDELSVEGNARIVRDDIDGRAPRLLVRRRDGIAVLSGGALVRQAQNEARAETITVDLRRRRFAAAGRASLVLQPGR